LPEPRPSRRLLLAFAPAALLLLASPVRAAEPPVRVVYQINEGSEQASRAIVNITNHLDAEPGVKIVVVAFGKGVDYLVDGAKDAHGNPFDAAVAGLTQRGVEFRVCHNTLVARGLDEKQINPEASIVPSGVAEIARLQFREHYAYLRP
jgi:intracellular sulfur oxidation DsrE/DsrF family protein